MKNALLPMLGLCILFGSNCNPECVSLVGVTPQPMNCSAGDEITISATPNESLLGRQIFFNDKPGVIKGFNAIQGLIVEVPDDLDANGQIELKIEDPDCGDFTPVSINVFAPGSLFNNPNFVFPSTPEILFPSSPPSYPPSIDNAWLSAQNADYCLWLQAEKDTFFNPNGTIKSIVVKSSIDPNASFELSTCLIGAIGFQTDPSSLFHFNNVKGFVDTVNNYIFIQIDRSKQLAIPANLRIENFEGRFLDADDETAKLYNVESLPLNCGGTIVDVPMAEDVKTKKNQMMLLKSLTSGRQLLIMHKKD